MELHISKNSVSPRRLSGMDANTASTDMDSSESKTSCCTVFETFATSTTAHGVPHLIDSKSNVRKLIWLIVVLGVFSGFSYHLSTLVSRYISRPVNVAMSVETPQFLTFPAVTICNKNSIRKSAIETNDEYREILDATNTDMGKYEILGGKCLGDDTPCNVWPEKFKEIAAITCIKPYMECNKRQDCDNFADESKCYSAFGEQCDAGMFSCDNGNCIPTKLVCNYVDNCFDGSDEKLSICPPFRYPNCTEFQWQCNSGQCIDAFFVCDHIIDCADMSDELDICNNGVMNLTTTENITDTNPQTKVTCGSDQFVCGDICENNIRKCDGMSGCPRGVDEKNCNYSVPDPFPDGWYEPYESILEEDERMDTFDEFKNKVYKATGFHFIPKKAEDPPIWEYFFLASRIADYSDLKDVLKLSKEQIKKFGHQLKDMVMDCTFGQEKCNMTGDFTSFQNGKYGNCYTFNNGQDESSLRRMTESGPENGLKMSLYLEQNEYTALFGQSAGIRIQVHSQNETPFPEDKGIGIGPGMYTHMGFRKKVRERKGHPYGDCEKRRFLPKIDEEKSNTFYSLLSCRKYCLQMSLSQYCGCITGNLRPEGTDTVPLCRVLNDTQVVCSQLIQHLYMKKKLKCDCKVPCHEESYDSVLSQYVWPSNIYKESLLSTAYGQSRKTWQLTEKDTRDNLLRVAIYYEDMNYERIYEKPAYELSQLWADIGGALGLWIGVSCVTVIEFLEFLINVCLWTTKRARLPR